MKPHLAVAALALTAATLAACGGGGGGASPFISLPASASSTATLSTSTTTAVSLAPITNGSSATVTLPAVSGSTSATLSLQSALPTGATTPQAKTMAKTTQGIGQNVTALDYVLLTVSQTVSVTQTPSFVFSFASAPPAGTPYIAELDLSNVSAGWSIFAGPGTESGNTISIKAQTLAPPFTFTAGHTYVLALVVAGAVITPPPPTIPPNTNATFTGNKSVNYTYGFNFDYPRPAPSVSAPPVTMNYSVTENVTVGTSPFPSTAPSAQLVDEHIAETDSGDVASQTFTTDAWVGLGAGGSQLLYGQLQQQPTSANLPMTTTIYGTPQILDKLPEASGSWTNVPTASVAYNYADGNSGTRAIASDGTYVDTEQLGGAQAVITTNSDGSGSMTGPFYGGGILDSITVTGPTPEPSGSPMLAVALNFSTFAQQNYGYPAQQVIPDPVWYPYTPGSPLTFYSETDAVTTGVALPSGCMPSPYSTANDVKRTIMMLDPMIGFVETTTFDSYNVNGFPVCLNTNDVLNYAYSLQGNTPYTIFIGTQLGLQVVTTNETLVLQNAPASSAAAAHAMRSQSMTTANASVAALQAHELSSFAAQRARYINAYMRMIRNAHAPPVSLIRGGH